MPSTSDPPHPSAPDRRPSRRSASGTWEVPASASDPAPADWLSGGGPDAELDGLHPSTGAGPPSATSAYSATWTGPNDQVRAT